jgi:exodeoxyribonuclease VII large subunit
MAMDSAVKQGVAEKSKEFSALCAKLDAMSPLRILARGYGVVSKNGTILTDSACVAPGDKINVTLSRGGLECEVVSASKDG